MHSKTRTKRRRRRAKKAEPMSMVGYAEHRGVTRASVAKALQTGRISKQAAAKNDRGHWEIDAELADQEWTANSVREKAGESVKRRASSVRTVPSAERLLQFGKAAIPVNEDGEEMSRTDVATIREAALAKQAQLDLAERKGGLMRVEDAQRLLADLGRDLNDALLAVPARCAAACAAESDVAAVEILVEKQIVSALEALTRLMEKVK